MTAAARPGWLPPGYIALTGTSGMPLFLDARRIAGVTPVDGGGSAVYVAGLEGQAMVAEPPAEVFHAITTTLR